MLSRTLRHLAAASSTDGKLSPFRPFALFALHGGVWEANKKDDDVEELLGGSKYGHVTAVHPTAVVHPRAVLGQGVSIGPFCTVGCYAKIGDACQLHPGSHVFGETELGDHSVLLAGAIVGADIPGRTIIGSNNIIGHHATVGVKCQDMKYKTDVFVMRWHINLQVPTSIQMGDECYLHIGDNNDIREHVSIHRSSSSTNKTVIGDENLIMGSSHIAHDCKVGSHNIFANGTLLAGHIVVEDYCHTAGAAVVHQFCHLGSFCFIGGGSVITQDVPKYMMVSGDRAELRGLNLEGLQRHGFSHMEVRSLRKAYRKIFMRASNSEGIEGRLSEVEESEELSGSAAVRLMIQSIRGSFGHNRRGICRFRHWVCFSKASDKKDDG